MAKTNLDEKCINTIRCLAMDAALPDWKRHLSPISMYMSTWNSWRSCINSVTGSRGA